MISGIGGIGSLPLKPEIGGFGAALAGAMN